MPQHNDFTIWPIADPIVLSSGGSTTGVVGDSNVNNHTSAVVCNNYTITMDYGDFSTLANATETVTPAGRTHTMSAPAAFGRYCDHLSDATRYGMHYAWVTRSDIGVAGCTLDMRPFSASGTVAVYSAHTTNTFASFADGVAWQVHRDTNGWQVTGRLDGNGDPSPTYFLQRFTSVPAVSLEVPHVSMIHSKYGLCSASRHPNVGSVLTFVDSSEQKVSAVVSEVRLSPDYDIASGSNDWAVVVLDKPLPASCGVFSLLPDDWRSRLTSLAPASDPKLFVKGALPAAVVNRNNEGSVLGVYNFTPSECRLDRFIPTGTARNDYKALTADDFGSPVIVADWIANGATPYLIGLVNKSNGAQPIDPGVATAVERAILDPSAVVSRGNLLTFPTV